MIGGRKTRSNKGKKRQTYKKKSSKFNRSKLFKKKEFPSKNLVFEEWQRSGGLTDSNKKVAKKRLLISYMGGIIKIPKGQTYYMHNNKILVGWHGTTNPPQGM